MQSRLVTVNLSGLFMYACWGICVRRLGNSSLFLQPRTSVRHIPWQWPGPMLSTWHTMTSRYAIYALSAAAMMHDTVSARGRLAYGTIRLAAYIIVACWRRLPCARSRQTAFCYMYGVSLFAQLSNSCRHPGAQTAWDSFHGRQVRI